MKIVTIFDNIVRWTGRDCSFFYCTQVKKEIVILHAFIKKTQETPIKELEIAKKRMKEVKNND
ncbi:hypothetical cytosolic protein [Coxiella burnetii]|nr:hypothetical cytosolic protein [Coxiella burnetii]